MELADERAVTAERVGDGIEEDMVGCHILYPGRSVGMADFLKAAARDEEFFHQAAVKLVQAGGLLRFGQSAAETAHHAFYQLADEVVGQRFLARLPQQFVFTHPVAELVADRVAPLVAVGIVAVACPFLAQGAEPLPVAVGEAEKHPAFLRCLLNCLCVFHVVFSGEIMPGNACQGVKKHKCGCNTKPAETKNRENCYSDSTKQIKFF